MTTTTAASPDPVLERMMALHPKVIDLSLDRVWRLLADLGNPQDRLPPVIHVAGTNGKGSTVAFLRAFLEAAGLRVHVYTSPHLVRFNERIRVAGTLIDDAALTRLLERVEAVNAGKPITFFEVTTCAAFLAFAETPADVCILETGLGGRLDATNVVRRPAATVLSPIAMDHQQYLGDTIEAIAAEKSFILKHAAPCISAKQPRKVGKIVELRSLEVGCPTYVEGRDFDAYVTGESLVYRGREVQWTLPLPALPGSHQVHNATVALATIEALKDVDVSGAALAMGMKTVEWPGRLQRLTAGALFDLLPEGWELWLDGGHNPAAGKTLATFARSWRDRPLDMVVGMLETKDEAGFLEPMAARARRLRTVPVPGSQASRAPEQVAETARSVGMIDVAAAESVRAALRDLARDAGPEPRRVLICGSLYLIGSVLAENGV